MTVIIALPLPVLFVILHTCAAVQVLERMPQLLSVAGDLLASDPSVGLFFFISTSCLLIDIDA